MVDVAKEAFQSQNFRLASEIYERIISEKGPAVHLLLKLGNSLALDGQVTEAFRAFLKAYRLSKTIDSGELLHFIEALVKVSRDGMGKSEDYFRPPNFVTLKEWVTSEPFVCGICLSTALEPTTIYCGHSFCKKCLEKVQSNTCMFCGENPSISVGFQPNVFMTRLIFKFFPKLEEVSQLKKLANESFLEQNYDKALALYTQAIKISADDHVTWSNRSQVFTKLDKYEQALQDALQSIRLKPQWAEGYFRKGVACELLEKKNEAALSYMKCLAIDGMATPARTNLTKIVHEMLQPKMEPEDHKLNASAEACSTGDLSAASSTLIERSGGLPEIIALLEQQAPIGDTELKFESQVSSLDASMLTADMFECGLCYRFLYNPITTPCGHVFCQHCLDRSMDHSVCCPQCRGDLSDYLAHRHHSVTVSIQRIISLFFEKESAERKLLHEEDMIAFSITGQTAEIPIFVCTMAFPTVPCPLHIFEPRYRLMIRQVMESGVRQFGMCLSIGPEDTDYAEYGTMLEIKDVQFFDDGRSVVDTVGGRRFHVLSKSSRDGYAVARVEFVDDEKLQGGPLTELQAMHDDLYSKVCEWFSNLPHRISNHLRLQFGDIPVKDANVQAVFLGPKWLWWVTAILPIDPRAQLSILQMRCLKERLTTIDRVITCLQNRQ
ncbi:LON peptidase N-terminal domain and RING finger protein 3-like [Watersipora subatra]|uniref:LON peptidase N-terminal domain and RING finger protein 3-like n=1 Tax=Watersipora subatra TaxID=2589382 RepID=UPI00355AE1E6